MFAWPPHELCNSRATNVLHLSAWRLSESANCARTLRKSSRRLRTERPTVSPTMAGTPVSSSAGRHSPHPVKDDRVSHRSTSRSPASTTSQSRPGTKTRSWKSLSRTRPGRPDRRLMNIHLDTNLLIQQPQWELLPPGDHQLFVSAIAFAEFSEGTTHPDPTIATRAALDLYPIGQRRHPERAWPSHNVRPMSTANCAPRWSRPDERLAAGARRPHDRGGGRCRPCSPSDPKHHRLRRARDRPRGHCTLTKTTEAVSELVWLAVAVYQLASEITPRPGRA